MARSAAYSASKFGVIGFTEAVGLEVRGSGVKVSVVEPGSVQTGFSEITAQLDWRFGMTTWRGGSGRAGHRPECLDS